MAKERLPDFVVHTDTLQSSGERMPQVVKVQIVNSDSTTGFTPVFLTCPQRGPTAEYSVMGSMPAKDQQRLRGYFPKMAGH
jgi:hypothetical protein